MANFNLLRPPDRLPLIINEKNLVDKMVDEPDNKQSKKENSKNKSKIKQEEFKGRNISSIGEHKQVKVGGKKKLVPPLMNLQGIQFVSWANDKMPDMLWAALIHEALDRPKALEIFRKIIGKARKFINRKDVFITHSAMAKLKDAEFDELMQDVYSDLRLKIPLNILLLFDNLPDLHHWARHLKREQSDGTNLARAIAPCLDHQSEQSTDLKWLKISFLAVQQLVYMPDTDMGRQLVDEMCGYPNVGDQGMVMSGIRSFEVGILPTEESKLWAKNFWSAMWNSSDPAPYRDFKNKELYPTDDLFGELLSRQKAIEDNFYETSSPNPTAPREYLIHLLPMYANYMCIGICRGDVHRRAEGLLLLRVITEVAITFNYLLMKDDESLWQSYEAMGRGKAKEAFLKFLEMEEVPRFVDMKDLDYLVNEAQWMEFQSIDLSHWDNTNLREMSIKCGMKEFYDKYYLIPSAYTHGHWPALDGLLLSYNLNPLHRHKKIPLVANLRYKSVIYDSLVVVNALFTKFQEIFPAKYIAFKKEYLEEIRKSLDEYEERVGTSAKLKPDDEKQDSSKESERPKGSE